MGNKNRAVVIIIVIALFLLNFFNKKGNRANTQIQPTAASVSNTQNIEHLTDESLVVPYVKEHHRLPPCYLTKNEARKLGWDPQQGNLCDVLPGRAIGGDRFSNREHALPDAPGRKWFEADINFDCGRRGADRLLFSSDGLMYVTKNHYQTFQRQ